MKRTEAPLKPGSFTKNFSWKAGQGLKELHNAIRIGFDGRLSAPTRSEFRERIANNVDGDALIVCNFFVFNYLEGDETRIALDELTSRAIVEPHDQTFDRLAIFAFLLGVVGKWKFNHHPVQSFGALWVQKLFEEIYDGENWKLAELSTDQIQSFADRNKVANSNGPTRKLATNLNYLLLTSGYKNSEGALKEKWLDPALFLAFDRHSLSTKSSDLTVQNSASKDWLKSVIPTLTGIEKIGFNTIFNDAFEIFLKEGGLNRFGLYADESTEASQITDSNQTPTESKGKAGLVETSLVLINKRSRDRSIGRWVKSLYEDQCAICDTALLLNFENQRYSEAGHVKPIGYPHFGDDASSNVVIFCPNHHKLFDKGAAWMKPVGTNFETYSLGESGIQSVGEFCPNPKHDLDAENVIYHLVNISLLSKL